MARGLTIGHEPVGVIEKLGSAVIGFMEGQRVIAGAITPSGHSAACLCGCLSQDGAGTKHGFKAIGGWKFGNTIDGCQAEYLRVPDAMANLALVPDNLTDEQVLMCPDIMSTGFSGAESGILSFGNCCHPVPGDDIVGYLSPGKGIVVHRVECPNVAELFKLPERRVEIGWDSEVQGDYRVELRVEVEIAKAAR